MERPAQIGDLNQAFSGSVPRLLVNCGFDVQEYKNRLLAANATLLREDQWEYMEDAVLPISRMKARIVSDLVANGLTLPIPNGLGKTILKWEDSSDISDASISMAAEAADQGDRVVYTPKTLPLPIIHKGFSLNVRELQSSMGQSGEPVDVTNAQASAAKVGEKIESVFALGDTTVTVGGVAVEGILNFTHKQSDVLTAAWTASNADPVEDIRSMKQKSINAYHEGPWGVYIPTLYEEVLDDDYVSGYPKTIRQRIMEIGGIQFIHVCNKFTANYVALVELLPTTIRAVIGLQPTMLEWQTMGGLLSHFKVMAIVVPQIRADQAGNSGVVVATV
jgi:hypothetical protein